VNSTTRYRSAAEVFCCWKPRKTAGALVPLRLVTPVPVGQDDDAPDPLVAAIEGDLRQRLRDEPQLLEATLVSGDDDDDDNPAL
jgi:hypothetical protein